MGEAPGGTLGLKRWGSARRAERAGGRRAGQPREGRRRLKGGLVSSLVRT